MKFIILSPVDHNGKRLQPGATADMSKADAADLLEVGAIAPYDAKLAKAVEESAGTEESSVKPLDPNDPPVPPETEGAAA
jgi:hypothetical protein